MKIIKYWKSFVVAIIIFYGSITSGSNVNKVNFLNIKHFDKIAHFTLYFIFAITLYSSLLKNESFRKTKKIVITLLITILYGLLMESFQYLFTNDRSPEIYDALANTLGSIFGILILPLLVKLKLYKYL